MAVIANLIIVSKNIFIKKSNFKQFNYFIAKSEAQRVEDICVSMIGLIIALIITALLALVAVAIAVSCWLMAYRRRPKTTGPLSHPAEIPNPIFTTENSANATEPLPDYLS